MFRLRRAALLAAAFWAACATTGPGRSPLDEAASAADERDASAATLAAAGFHAWIAKNDPAAAGKRFAAALARDPAQPWGLWGTALLARRELDDAAEVKALGTILTAAPAHPLAAVAARRLGEISEIAIGLTAGAEAALHAGLDKGALSAAAAHRARVALATAASARGDFAAVHRARAEAGSISAWSLAGPFGAYHALELDRPFGPERGAWAAPPGGLPPRPLPTPDGIATLEGEPHNADIYYLAADVTLAKGGDYLVYLSTGSSAKLWVDGALLAVRRTWQAYLPVVSVTARSLSAGRHRVLVKVGRGSDRTFLAVSLGRADGAPTDASSAPASGDGPAASDAPAGDGPANAAGQAALERTEGLFAAMEREAGPALAGLVAARDAIDLDREGAKELVEAALLAAPASSLLRAGRADLLRDDPSLAERIARARAEADYDAALAADPDDAATRLKRAELMRADERADDAAALLSKLKDPAAARPRALYMRARVAVSRGFAEGGERLAEEARQKGGHCLAVDLLYDAARRRDAIGREDALAQDLARCRGGRERLAEHLRERGDLGAMIEAWRAVAAEAPSKIDPRMSLAQAQVSAGDLAGAAEELAALEAIWPRASRIFRRRADALELAGDGPGARAERERALALDGADLPLRRALALEKGGDVLDAYAEDGRAAIKAYQASRPKGEVSGVVVLDAAAVEAYPDGAQTERIHQVIHVLDQPGVERFGEVQIPGGAEAVTVRTIKKDGRVLEPEETGGDKHSVSMAGLEPGDFIEYEYLHAVASRGASIPGFSTDPFYFRVADTPLWRSSYVVLAPPGTGMEVDAHNMPPVAVEKEKDGREVVRALRTEVPALVAEPNAPAATEFLPFVQLGAGAGRQALQLAYADGLLDRSRPGREVKAFAREAAAGKSGEALVRALYAATDKAILGHGASWSESASQVLSRGRGNRLTLLKALCELSGVKARYALVRAFNVDPAPYRFPHLEHYGYVVLKVDHAGKTYWLDDSVRLTPFGVLPAAVRGSEALLLPEPGEAPAVARTPDADPSPQRELDIQIALAPDGSATVKGVERYLGHDGAAAKASVERLDGPQRKQTIEQSLAHTFRGFSLAELTVEGELAPEEPLTLRWSGKVPGLARVGDAGAVIDSPLFAARLSARFVQRATRETPMLIGSSERVLVRIAVTPAEGTRAEPAGEKTVTSELGSFQRSEKLQGTALVREDRYELVPSRIAPAAYGELVRFAGAVDDAQAQPLVFRREPGVPADLPRAQTKP